MRLRRGVRVVLHGFEPRQERRDADTARHPDLHRARFAGRRLETAVRPFDGYALPGADTFGQAPGVVAQRLALDSEATMWPRRDGHSGGMRSFARLQGPQSETHGKRAGRGGEWNEEKEL